MAARKVATDTRKHIRMGVLGCGFMGKCHANAYKTIPYIYRRANLIPHLLVLCDKNDQIVEREAARYGYEEYCTDWNELVADERIDVVDNCGPDPVHPQPCIAALNICSESATGSLSSSADGRPPWLSAILASLALKSSALFGAPRVACSNAASISAISAGSKIASAPSRSNADGFVSIFWNISFGVSGLLLVSGRASIDAITSP